MDSDWIDELGDLSCPECGSQDICEHSMNIDQIEIGLPDAPGIFMIDCIITSYESWVIDTGSSNHICNHLQGFTRRETLRKDRTNLRVGEGTPLIAEAVGSYCLTLPSGLVLQLENCYYVPKMIKNVINLQNDNKEIYHISKRSKDIEDQTYLWHCRLGHINKKRIELLLKGGFLGTFDFKPFDNCESCLSGKMTKQPFNKDNERATELLEIIHTYVCGPFSHEARGGYRYFFTFTDDFSRYDRGGEYLSQEFGNHLMKCGIVSQLTPPYTPQMNGVSERRNRKLLDMTTVGYYFYNAEENKVFVARNGKFLEEKFLSSGNTRKDVDLQIVDEDNTTPTVEPEIQHENVEPQSEPILEVQTQDLRRSTRVWQEPDRYLGFLVSQVGGDLNEPASYGEAVSGNESEQWQEAMKAEMQSMYHNQVWELTDLPQHCRAVGHKWVFKKKSDMDGNVHTFKARLVAKGFTQTHDLQMDVKTTFLNGKLTEDVYMEQPERFEDPKNPNKMKDLGEAAYILGIKIYRNRSKRLIGLSQSTYIDKILKKFRMDESKKGFIPMQHGILLSKTRCPVSSKDQDKMKSVPYASAIGSIMYAMLCTRPDVAYSVSVTSKYQYNPGEPHWVVVKNILKSNESESTKGADTLRDSIFDHPSLYFTADLLEPFEVPEREFRKRNKKKSKTNKVRPRALIFEMGDEAPMWTARRAAPTVPTNPITKPNLNKEIPWKLLHIIKDLTFDGKNDSNPIVHMENFVDICDLFKTEADRDDAIRLRVFPLTLTGETRAWLRSLEPSSITTWEGLR
ncbi:hypothetical protein OSB04_016834 [Centaurea solstitialis]|uniref:Integrase catalytic domain-containing protein n=1 Tax=Centaurea solstitialis TaxID=347529 RepID=A0AA38T3D9_9ASTR|nr:hypothetical protein OSB04_016834 [Centaurea solstitialis]